MENRMYITKAIEALVHVKEELISGLWYLDELGSKIDSADEMLLRNVYARVDSLEGIAQELRETFQDRWDDEQEE